MTPTPFLIYGKQGAFELLNTSPRLHNSLWSVTGSRPPGGKSLTAIRCLESALQLTETKGPKPHLNRALLGRLAAAPSLRKTMRHS
jgi:hypothetical protein